VNKPLTPLDHKRLSIGKIFVQHTDVVAVRELLNSVSETSFRLREMETLYFRGWTRCGKSETIKRWIYEQTGQHVIPGVALQLLEGNGIRIIYADMTSGATPMQASQMIGSKLFGSNKILSLKELQVTDEFIRLLSPDDGVTTFLIVDEAQWLLRSLGPKGADRFAAWVLTIENARAFQLVLVGAPFLELLQLMVEAADARQAGSRLLKPFGFRTEDQQAQYGAFSKSFAGEVPYESNWIKEGLETSKRYETLHALFFATRGRPGTHAKLHEHAAVASYRRTGSLDSLSKEDFCAAFELRYLANAKYQGFNPFKDSDFKRLPQFPLTIEEDPPDEQMKTFMKAKSKSRKGGKLYGEEG
jgi:hypothetical protein